MASPDVAGIVRLRTKYLADAPERRHLLHSSEQSGGVFLWGTLGTEAALRPDGSVWLGEAPIGEDGPVQWRRATEQERLGLLSHAAPSWPELRTLLRARP